MVRPNILSSRGFTLVEMMFSVGISAFIMAAVISAYVFLGGNLYRMGYQGDIERKASYAMQVFESDVSVSSGFDFSTTAINPSPSAFEIDQTVPLASGGSVSGISIYTYTAGTGGATGTLTVIHRTPVAMSTLYSPSWATQDVGQPDAPRTILTGINSLNFYYYRQFDMAPPSTQPNDISTKMIQMAFTITSPTTGTSSSTATGTYQTGSIVMRNKGLLTDPNQP
jgi:prepilin-type N-terminal cleavage/methylation domain-containing protein